MSTSCVNLKALCNAGFHTALTPQTSDAQGFPIPAKKLDGLPIGENVFARVGFRIAAPKGSKDDLFVVLPPEDQVRRQVKVNASFTAMYLLHAMNRGDLGRTPVVYTFHYADGTSAERPIVFGEDVADWLFPREFDNCFIGWTGYHKDNEYQKCLFVAEIANPFPRKEVASVSLKRNDHYGQYVLAGMTLSTEAPFFRAAKKGGRAGLADYIDMPGDILRVRDGALAIEAAAFTAEGKPLAGAKLSASIAGKRFDLSRFGSVFAASIPKEKGWRRYANTARVEARKGGKVVARREAVFYADGYPRLHTPPHGHTPPQFIILGVDDCSSIPGLEAMLEIMERVAAKGAKAVFTMYTAPVPPRSPDLQKQVLLFQRMFDMGCEFCNHTLHHNPGGVNWYNLPDKEQTREIAGCRDWMRENIDGLWHVYSQKTGGGGAGGIRDPKFTRELMKSQHFEYNANNVTAMYDTDIPHPDVQFWPYKLGDEWSIDMGLIDGDAPPVHRPITKGFFTDYSGKFDYETADGAAMLKANFEYRYKDPNRPPLIINALHDWGMAGSSYAHRNQKAIVEGFLMDVLVTNRKKYPNTHVITFHQLIEYMRRDDIEAILAEGSGQGR
jgi:peptidoglycan/xylan/chitin deacetylase (PgdA/CDA1 family)